MIITINTKEDSHDDIMKVIKMLQHLVGEHALTNSPDIFNSQTATIGENNLMSMFDAGSNAASEPVAPINETKEEEIPKIVPY